MSTELRTKEEILAARVVIPDDVILRSFVTETVVLNLNTGKYHGLNPSGGRMLDVLVEVDNVEAAARILASEYGRDADGVATDLCEFCLDLEQRRLIQFSEGA